MLPIQTPRDTLWFDQRQITPSRSRQQEPGSKNFSPPIWATVTLRANTRMSKTGEIKRSLTLPRPRASLVIVGAFTCLFCTVGFLNSSGIFLEYYARDTLSSEPPSTIAWIGALAIFFLFAMSPGVGAMLDVFGPTASLASALKRSSIY